MGEEESEQRAGWSVRKGNRETDLESGFFRTVLHSAGQHSRSKRRVKPARR